MTGLRYPAYVAAGLDLVLHPPAPLLMHEASRGGGIKPRAKAARAYNDRYFLVADMAVVNR